MSKSGTAIVSTSGAPIRLARLRDQMKRDGLDIGEWNFPAASVLDAALNPTSGPKPPSVEPAPDEEPPAA